MYANKVLASIPFGSLIGQPMNAAVEAQALAAKTSVMFIKEVGFTGETESEEFGDVRMVTFKYKARDEEGDGTTLKEITLQVPILTIVPIPYLRIDELTIDFTSKITESMEYQKDKKTEFGSTVDTDIKAGAFFSPVKANVKASVSVKHTSTSSTKNRYQTEHNINVNVRAVQDDLPRGMSRVLDILENAIRDQIPADSGNSSN